MEFKNSFEAIGEAMVLRAEGEALLAKEIHRALTKLARKIFGQRKQHAVAAE